MDNFTLLIPIVIYACLNVLAFGAFAIDKYRAQTNAWRTPEIILILFSALGPFGAFAGMKILRHKTRHTKFLLVPIFAVLHILFATCLFTPLFR